VTFRGIVAVALVVLASSTGCGPSAAKPRARLEPASPPSFALGRMRGDPDALVILALSGGGSRAAYFAAAAMFRLEKLGILGEVDAISSVSGGSLPAAYYGLSREPGDGAGPSAVTQVLQALRVAERDRPSWREADVKNLMKRNYTREWFLRWFLPQNVLRYWFTDFTRTDIMADVFARDLFGAATLAELSPERPAIILNATNATENADRKKVYATLTFTAEDFQDGLGSDVGSVRLARAVMTTAAFPGAFAYVNFPDRRGAERRFVHVFDGGNADNLGLTSANRLIDDNFGNVKRIAVILVDAYAAPPGIGATKKDPRRLYDYVIDTNFLDTYDALLTANRKNMLAWFYWGLERYREQQATFCHVTWEPRDSPVASAVGGDLADLRPDLDRIPTDFQISESDARLLDRAAELLVTAEDPCLAKVRGMVEP
jgi:predicted acylesterase/phospholipase RssA